VLQINNLQLIIAEYKVSSYSLETIRLNIGYAVRKWAHYNLAKFDPMFNSIREEEQLIENCKIWKPNTRQSMKR
jgi:hypothetical protein